LKIFDYFSEKEKDCGKVLISIDQLNGPSQDKNGMHFISCHGDAQHHGLKCHTWQVFRLDKHTSDI
jgi:hypothetical protein